MLLNKAGQDIRLLKIGPLDIPERHPRMIDLGQGAVAHLPDDRISSRHEIGMKDADAPPQGNPLENVGSMLSVRG